MSSPIEFDVRPASSGPIRFETHAPGRQITEWEPAAGDTASLHLEGVTIFVRITDAKDRKYTAEIVGFERHDNETFKGLKPGDVVNFSYSQAFGFGRL
jgi:hypothetical protein